MSEEVTRRLAKKDFERDIAEPAASKPWLIWSNEHRAWWGPNRHGYYKARGFAGRYTFAEALEIVTHANYAPECANVPNEAMVPDQDYP